MQLTVEAIIETLRTLTSDGVGDSPRGRTPRRLPRVGLRMQITILPLSDESMPRPATVRLRNMSPAGLGFLMDEPLREGQQFLIRLPRDRGGSAHLLGVVQRCRKLDGVSSHDVGATLRLDVPREEMARHVASVRNVA